MLYTLIDKNEIKVGPREYHVGPFHDYLLNKVDYSIIISLPVTYSQQNTIKISDDISIIPTNEPFLPAYNPLTEDLCGPYWEINNSEITGSYQIVDLDIQFARNNIKQKLSNIRYEKENTQITITIQDTDIQISTKRGVDRDIWNKLLISAQEPINYKFNSDTWINLTKDNIVLISQKIDAHVQSTFDWEFNIIQLINNANTKEELENIDQQHLFII